MTKERFPEQRKSKLYPRGDGLFQVLKRILTIMLIKLIYLVSME